MPDETPKKKKREPLTSSERSAWNKFLRFVHEKGYTGDSALDNRNQSLGHSLMQQYNQQAGADSVSADMVPRVQWEFNYFKKHGTFPAYEKNDFGNFRNILASQVRQEDISPVDNWFGSLTSQQAYPVIRDDQGHNWGTDYDAFIDHVKHRFRDKYASR